MSMFGDVGGFGGGGGFGGFGRRFGGYMDDPFDRRVGAPAHAYEEYYRAYSMAMLPGKERLNVSYGGKIIMPTSALARLTQMDIASPYLFQISPHGSDKKTHAGVLEFIADEGNVHLPAWMMRQLGLNEGDPVRLNGTTLPKGKFVKIQAQTVDFLEISDPKAVLEQAFRNFSCLTLGDIVEISYNCLTFEILIMETVPEAEGILIIDTDLEVDFAPPKGYVEPAPKPRPPPPTMASKLNIDTNKVEVHSSRGSTPSVGGPSRADSSAGDASTAGPSGSSSNLPSAPFRGSGQSLSGKKSKGKKERPIEAVDQFSMIRRTRDGPNIVTNDTQVGEKKVPARLDLPFGQLFFGYKYIPVGGEKDEKKEGEQKLGQTRITFEGQGQTLSGRAPRRPPPPKEDDKEQQQQQAGAAEGGAPASSEPFSGQGQTLAASSRGARSSRKRERRGAGGGGGGTTGGGRESAIIVDDSD